ncbi:accessory secretory protein Asp2 [Weissella uvarum]|uniref:accessory Sec system protein Asp2 n=1 Tax=Weissella uvarum TaxID=1479233 RepID=UPI00195FA9D6|nr:accessory Sec system protein Asp2 [Weissella uvarum]MBM7616675.1 accessory secretory protein Asp2 [Weissella uvarum]MCM0594871.1 accessory Sec system protein Asp2 [Weissella uvarum]
MASKKQTPIIHIGQQRLELDETLLGPDFVYIFCTAAPTDENLEVFPEKMLLNPKTGRLNRQFANAIFLIDADFPWLTNLGMLRRLPANQILYLPELVLSDEVQALLDFKGAFAFDFQDVNRLAMELRCYFFIGSDGYRSNSVNFRAGVGITQPVERFGNVYTEYTVDFDDDWHIMAYHDAGADQSNYVPPYLVDHINLEYALLDPTVTLKLKVNKIRLNDHEIEESLEAVGDDIIAGLDVPGGATGYIFQVLVYAKGHGRVRLGNMHTRRSRGDFGTFMLNGQRIINGKLHDDIAYYFDPGDMQPPLNVYFSGWRTKEGFEGNRMMQSSGKPYMLVADERLEGGAFYMGDENFEQTLVQVIQEKLDLLGFNRHDVVLAGMSMGTFGALYYGAKLNPKAIVVGKPLTNLGDIAQNGRIKRPVDFHTGEDIQLYYEGDLSDEASERLNQRFWRVFNQGDFNDTTFALAYMEQDDYDDKAFGRIQASVKKRYEQARILSKGFEGRHNDNTADVAQWFKYHLNQVNQAYQE